LNLTFLKSMSAFFVALFILGLSFSVQFQAQQSPERELYKQRQENLIVMVKNLTEKRQRLSQEMGDLSNQLYDRRNSLEDETMTIRSLESQLARLNIANGTLPVVGKGIEIQFQATSSVAYNDLIVLVNELYAAGAEAIAIGDHRLTANSYIFYDDLPEGRVITVNNNQVALPLRVAAIGDTGNLEKGLTFPGGFMDVMMYNKIYPILRQKEELELPAMVSQPLFYYLSVYRQ